MTGNAEEYRIMRATIAQRVLAVLHLLFIARVRLARTVAAKQRALDLERFEALYESAAADSASSPPADVAL